MVDAGASRLESSSRNMAVVRRRRRQDRSSPSASRAPAEGKKVVRRRVGDGQDHQPADREGESDLRVAVAARARHAADVRRARGDVVARRWRAPRRGIEAVSFTGSQAGIDTNDRHSGARIVEVRPFRVEDELDRGKVVIVAGFQGVSYKREITTLGRGGSDTTAVAFAGALRADYCETLATSTASTRPTRASSTARSCCTRSATTRCSSSRRRAPRSCTTRRSSSRAGVGHRAPTRGRRTRTAAAAPASTSRRIASARSRRSPARAR